MLPKTFRGIILIKNVILTGSGIVKAMEAGEIRLDPFSQTQVNPNSYNYRLGSFLKEFVGFDGRKSIFRDIRIPKNGYVLKPFQTYLGSTHEIIGSTRYAMSLIGKSSMGRLGLFLQVSANLGHTGSCHNWTLELVACRPIILYPQMIIGQVSFWENEGEIDKYSGAHGAFFVPTESQTRYDSNG